MQQSQAAAATISFQAGHAAVTAAAATPCHAPAEQQLDP